MNAEPGGRPRVAVAGWGNPLRGDDAVGWLVAEAVEERWGSQVHVLVGQQPVPEWAADLAEADLAYFVDAAVNRPETDALEIRRLDLRTPTSGSEHMGIGAHALGPSELLQLTLAAYGHVPESYLLSVPVRRLAHSSGLSAHARAGVEAAIEHLAAELRRLGIGLD